MLLGCFKPFGYVNARLAAHHAFGFSGSLKTVKIAYLHFLMKVNYGG